MIHTTIRHHVPCRTLSAVMLFVTMATSAAAQQQDTTLFGWSSRKLNGVILSTIIPGAGQSYLGHASKGAAITIGFFGSGLMTLLSENNVKGRNERLDELKALYATSPNWTYSNELWLQMVETKSILDRDVKRRDLFLKITAALWVVSVVDAVLFTEDLGERTFGQSVTPSIDVAPVPGTNTMAVRTNLQVRF